jgi:hypothetical protein
MNHTKKELARRDAQLITGVLAHPPGELTFDGKAYSREEIVAVLQSRIDAEHAARTAEANFHAAVRDADATRRETDRFVSALRQLLLLANAANELALTEMGLAARRKPRTPTAEEKLAAAAKAAATRKARHTMGRRQRLAIKGEATDPRHDEGNTAAGVRPSAELPPPPGALGPNGPTTPGCSSAPC